MSSTESEAMTANVSGPATLAAALEVTTPKLSPSPEFSRLPPDGHEFPPNFNEPTTPYPIDSTLLMNHPSFTDNLKTPRKAAAYETVDTMNESTEMKAKPHGKPPTPRKAHWRSKDEKSEKSVREKISMFSNSTQDVSQFQPKTTPFKEPTKKKVALTKSIENIYSSSPTLKDCGLNGNGNIKKKAMSVENLDEFDGEVVVLREAYRAQREAKWATPLSAREKLKEQTKPTKISIESRIVKTEAIKVWNLSACYFIKKLSCNLYFRRRLQL